MEFGVFQDPGLEKKDAPVGIEACGQPVYGHFPAVEGNLGRMGVFRCEGVPVGNEVVALVAFLLEGHPVLQGSQIVAQVEQSRGPHPAQYSLHIHPPSWFARKGYLLQREGFLKGFS